MPNTKNCHTCSIRNICKLHFDIGNTIVKLCDMVPHNKQDCLIANVSKLIQDTCLEHRDRNGLKRKPNETD